MGLLAPSKANEMVFMRSYNLQTTALCRHGNVLYESTFKLARRKLFRMINTNLIPLVVEDANWMLKLNWDPLIFLS